MMKTDVEPTRGSAAGPGRWIKVLPHATLWLLIVLLFLPAWFDGEFWWTDEARHAMGGVFLCAVRGL